MRTSNFYVSTWQQNDFVSFAPLRLRKRDIKRGLYSKHTAAKVSRRKKNRLQLQNFRDSSLYILSIRFQSESFPFWDCS